jgi:hypothetical protein
MMRNSIASNKFIYIFVVNLLWKSEKDKWKDRMQTVVNQYNVYIIMVGLVYGAKRHFQQYFSYIVAFSGIGRGNRSGRRKPPTCPSHWQTLLHNVVSSWRRLRGVRTHNVSGDIPWLHR